MKPNEIILVEDGQLIKELYDCIENQRIKIGNILKTIKLEKNLGLREALKQGVLLSTNELIARMDTDDIAHPDRFFKQIKKYSSEVNDARKFNSKEFLKKY